MGNAYLSLMMQSAIENVFPVMVIEDPMKAPETLERGAGAVIPVHAGGRSHT
jgi:microcystin degradation protein MlrC